jgi:predicted acetyltransferase
VLSREKGGWVLVRKGMSLTEGARQKLAAMIPAPAGVEKNISIVAEENNKVKEILE